MDNQTRQLYEFGEYRLEPAEKLLRRNGNPVPLTPKAFEMLLVLVERSGCLVDKDELIKAVWADTFVEEANLARNIWALRKALGDDDSHCHRYIETVPKRGYRFVAPVREVPLEEPALFVRRRVRARIVKEEFETSDESESQTNVSHGATEHAEFHSATKEVASSRRATRIVYTTAIIVIAGLASALGFRFWKGSAPVPSVRINSIAVLPLRSLTEKNGEILGLGLTDAVITKLASLRIVTVRPTSAVFKFASSDLDALEVGRRLQTDAVLEGTIQQSEGRIRITARLLNVGTGDQMWSEKFDEPATDIFALQDALSRKITDTVAFELEKEQRQILAARPTSSSEAYEKYLRGRFFQTQNNERGFMQSIECYEQAIALDPNFADAYAGLADANVLLYNFGLRPPDDVLPKARQYINRALQLNPNLADVYDSLALVQFFSDHDWKGAEQSLRKAIALDPNNSVAFLRYGYFLINIGNFDEALLKLEKARELNPLSPMVQANIGLAYLCARHYQPAIEQLEKVEAENPELALGSWLLAAAYEGNGESERAFAWDLRALKAEGDGALADRLFKVKQSNGLMAANHLWLNESLKARRNRSASALTIASLYAELKNRQQTLTWLEKAADEREQMLSQIRYVAKYDFVRDDERFQVILKRIGFNET